MIAHILNLSRIRALTMLVFCAGLAFPARVTAQDPAVPSVTETLERFARLKQEDGNLGQRMVSRFLQSEPEQADLDLLVDGLARLAITHPEVAVKREAVAALFEWAGDTVERDPRGVVQVLEGVYREIPDAALKASITHRMADLGPRNAVIVFLRRVAVTEETPWEGIPTLAIEGLASLGEPGRAVLRELHAQDAVPVQRARWRLEDLARQDFRIGG